MKAKILAASLAIAASSSAMAADYNFEVTNLRAPGEMMAPLVVVDAGRADATMFNGGKMSEAFINTVLKGDPRPMNKTMPKAIIGPVLGQSGPPGVRIDGGETAVADMYVEGSSTIRFFAKGSYGEGKDEVVTGVWDLAMGGGTFYLNLYDIGHSEGTNEITLVKENVVKVTITLNED